MKRGQWDYYLLLLAVLTVLTLTPAVISVWHLRTPVVGPIEYGCPLYEARNPMNDKRAWVPRCGEGSGRD